MKCCFIKILLTASLVGLLYFVVLLEVRSPIEAEYWVRELIVVKRHFAAAMPSPKIIILGGSNVLYNFDAEKIEKELGIPTLNYGLHAGMRLEAILSEGKAVAKPRDIIVLPLEVGFYTKTGWSQWELRNGLAWDRSRVDSRSLWERIDTIIEAGTFDMACELVQAKIQMLFSRKKLQERLEALGPEEDILKKFREDQGRSLTCCHAYNIDNHGTMQHVDTSEYAGESVPVCSPGGIQPYARQLLVEFIGEMKKRNVQVYFAHSPYIVEGEAEGDWVGAEREFSSEIQALGSEVLDQREQLFLPRNMFFNTRYHLNTKGKEQRTKLLIVALKKKLQTLQSWPLTSDIKNEKQ